MFKKVFFGPLVALAIVSPAWAEDVTGRVTNIFGERFVLETNGAQLLVTPTTKGTIPQSGTTVTVVGTRSGTDFNASDIRVASAGTTETVPEPFRNLGLRNVVTHRDRDDDEIRISARLPSGSEVLIEYEHNRLHEVETSDSTALPAALLQRILPVNLTQTPEFREISSVTKVEFDDDGIEIDGRTADARIELDTDLSGNLLKVERKFDNRSRTAMDTGAARERLGALGYTDLSDGESRNERRGFIATNPYGERVAVQLDAEGRVIRERMLN